MALQQLRNASKTWVASLIIGALILAFALWGVNDIFQGGTDTTVAEVGDTTISTADFDRELKTRIRNVSQQMKTELSMEQARAFGLDKAVLDNMIARVALDEETKRLGLTASNAAVSAEIKRIPGLAGADGAFDKGLFNNMLQTAEISEPFFVESTRSDMARAQMLSSAMEGMAAPSGLTKLFYAFVSETRTAEYLVLTDADSGSVAEPTEDQLKAYHTAHAMEFNTPEYRKIGYVVIGTDTVSSDIVVTDAELKTEYDSNKAAYEKAETREVEQLPFPTRELADAASAKLKAGTDFTAMAREMKLSDTDVKLGTFPASGLDPRISGAVFAAAENVPTAPVEGPFGWVILRAVKINAGETKTLDQVKDQLRATLVNARATGKMADLANAFEDSRGSGASLAEAAKSQKLKLKRVESLDRAGLDSAGAKTDIPAAPSFLEQVFATESGEDSDIFQTDDGTYYAVHIEGVTPSSLKPLDTVRAQVRDGWMKEAKAKALETRVQSLTAAAGKAGSLGAASSALGRTPVKIEGMKRDQPGEIFGAPSLQQVFSVPQGGIVFAPGAKQGTYIIARVTAVVHKQPDLTSAEYQQFRQAMAQQLGDDLVEAFIGDAKKRAGVSIHQKTLDSVFGTPQ